MTINKIFDLLDDWRNLPSYQLERRADIFFAIHLEEIIYKTQGTKIDLIIPEFPVRIGELPNANPENNQSYKVDYLAYSRRKNKAYLVELKTDLKSKNPKQDDYLQSASKISFYKIIEGLLKIYKATREKDKYNSLFEKLIGIGWINEQNNSFNNDTPDIKPKVLYILPENKESGENVIEYNDIIKVFEGSPEPLTKRFIESLEKWRYSKKRNE